MKKIFLTVCILLIGCQSVPPSSRHKEGGGSSKSKMETMELPTLPHDWKYHQCPNQDPVIGCSLEFPSAFGGEFELQSDNAIINLGNQTYFTVQLFGNNYRNFSASDLANCKEHQIMQGNCDRYVRLDIQNKLIRIIGFGIQSDKKTFIYFIFTPTQSYFIHGFSQNEDLNLLDTSILNLRPSIGMSSVN